MASSALNRTVSVVDWKSEGTGRTAGLVVESNAATTNPLAITRTSSTGIHAALFTPIRRVTLPFELLTSCPIPPCVPLGGLTVNSMYGPAAITMLPAFTWASNAATSSAAGSSPAPST